MAGAVQPKDTAIGALIRAIEDEKSKAPHKMIPGTEPSTPVREAAAAPLEAPVKAESRGSERNIGLKAEGITSPSGTEGIEKTPGKIQFGGMGGGDFQQGSQTQFKYDVEQGKYPGIQSVGDGVFEQDPNAPQVTGPVKYQTPSSPAQQPSLQDYLNQGKTVDQWYAETGRQGELDAIRRDPGKSIDARGNITIGKQAPSSPSSSPSPTLAATPAPVVDQQRSGGSVLGASTLAPNTQQYGPYKPSDLSINADRWVKSLEEYKNALQSQDPLRVARAVSNMSQIERELGIYQEPSEEAKRAAIERVRNYGK